MNWLVILVILAAFCINAAFSERWSMKNLLPEPRAAHGEMCLSGDGSSYRGYESLSVYNRKCLRWTMFKNPWGASEGVGKHNYCRNPDKSLMPWCRVQRGERIVKQFCNIPRCSTPAVKPPPRAAPPADTELTCGEMSERKLHKIVGGSFTPIEAHPWVAAIFRRGNRFNCGGTLIAPCWVVSAAHCFNEIKDIQHLSVYLGKTAINETDADREQRFTVEKLIVHQKFNQTNFDNDIALLKIKSSDGRCAVKSASVRTACFPPLHTKLPAGFQCSIAGFGHERHMAWHNSQYLKKAEVNLISQTDCAKSYNEDQITQNMFCAGSPDWSTDACQNDSGGPLVCEVSGRAFLFGVVSWGEGCALKNKPGVYTQVTNYNKWIAKKTGLSKYTEGVMFPQK